MRKDKLHIFRDAAAVADALSHDFEEAVNESLKHKQRVDVAISGGDTPGPFFARLASEPFKGRIPWKRVHFFWVDERCVPPGDPESNYGMTKRLLLDRIAIPESNIHRMHGENDAFDEAKRYAHEMVKQLSMNDGGIPVFDWILLGMGVDGHMASIFPDSSLMTETGMICSAAKHPETGQHRVTLTLQVIDQGKKVLFQITGKKKAGIVSQILRESGGSEKYPASHVRPVHGALEWYLDELAAEHLLNTEF
jgi:6-phosphogluconolactonase